MARPRYELDENGYIIDTRPRDEGWTYTRPIVGRAMMTRPVMEERTPNGVVIVPWPADKPHASWDRERDRLRELIDAANAWHNIDKPFA